MIEVRGLVKSFGLRPVLRGLDLDVEPGEFLLLMGPNGSGKTTLLRVLAGLSKPTAGLVKIAGYTLPAQAHAVRARLGVVLHHPLLYGELTARENLLLYARLYSLGDYADRIERMLDRVGLLRRADDLVRTFSRGMQQRLAIARSLLHGPDLLLMDEPYTGLDHDAARILDDILDSEKAAGHTILMVTHDPAHLDDRVDRVAVLSRGRVRLMTGADAARQRAVDE